MTAAVAVELPLPALATLSGGVRPPAYCPTCLDVWSARNPDVAHGRSTHEGCVRLLEELRAAPPSAVWDEDVDVLVARLRQGQEAGK